MAASFLMAVWRSSMAADEALEASGGGRPLGCSDADVCEVYKRLICMSRHVCPPSTSEALICHVGPGEVLGERSMVTVTVEHAPTIVAMHPTYCGCAVHTLNGNDVHHGTGRPSLSAVHHTQGD